MFEFLSTMNTNESIVTFVLNNLVLLMLIKYCLEYICQKTPWAADDDLPSFFGGLIDIVKKKPDK